MHSRIVTRITVLATVGALVAGCASQQGTNTAVGAAGLGALGAAVGGIVGGAKGAAIGGAAGLAIGAAAGYGWDAISKRLFGTAQNTGTTVTQKPDSVMVTVPINTCTRNKGCELDASSSAVLAQVAQEMKTDPTLTVDINGFSDASGTQAGNEHVSLQRAKKVQDYLTQLGVRPDRIKSVDGLGAQSPIVDNNSPDRWKNRRVELYLHSPSGNGMQPCSGPQCPQASQ